MMYKIELEKIALCIFALYINKIDRIEFFILEAV